MAESKTTKVNVRKVCNGYVMNVNNSELIGVDLEDMAKEFARLFVNSLENVPGKSWTFSITATIDK